MLYPLLTLSDQTEMLYSEIKPDGRVKVYVEKPDAKDCANRENFLYNGKPCLCYKIDCKERDV